MMRRNYCCLCEFLACRLTTSYILNGEGTFTTGTEEILTLQKSEILYHPGLYGL